MFRNLFRSRKFVRPGPRGHSFRPRLEPLEDRCVPAVINWTATDNGDFNNAANWTVSGSNPPVHRVPGPLDDAVIPGTFVVTSSVNQTVNSISATGLRVLGGTFSMNNVNADSQVTGLVVGTGATFRPLGRTTNIIVSEVAGTLDVPVNSTLRFLRGAHNLNPGALLTGAGQYLLLGDVFGGPTVVLNTDITAPANVLVNWGVFDGPGKLTIPTGVTFDVTSTNGVTALRGSGITEIQPGATLLLAGAADKTLADRTINNAGTIRYVDAGRLLIDGNAVINNLVGATFRIENDVDFLTSLTAVIHNAGTFLKTSPTGTGETVMNIRLHNSGLVRIDSGSLALDRLGTHTGTFNLAGGDLTFSTSGDGAATLDPGTTFLGTGAVRLTDKVIVANANVSFSKFVMSGGFLEGAGTVTFTGTATWSGGTMRGTGVTVVASGATLAAITGATNKILSDGRTLRNLGTITHTGTGALTFAFGATLDNQAGATYTLNSDAGFTGAVHTVTNAGTFVFTSPSGSGTAPLTHFFNNTGTVRINAGTLNLNGGGVSTGAFNLAGGDLRFGGGEFTFNAGTTVTGTGTLHFTIGTLTVNAAVSVPNYTQSGGDLEGPGTLTISQSGSFTGGRMVGPGTTVVAAGATLSVTGGSRKEVQTNRVFDNFGTVTLSNAGAFDLGSGVVFTNKAGATFDIQSDADMQGPSGTIVNQGTFKKSAGVLVTQLLHGFTNQGVLRVETGTLHLTQPLTQTGGTTFVAVGATLQSTTVTITGGTLNGTGTVAANVSNGGTVAPGTSPGLLTITGTYTQTANGILTLELGGTTPGTGFDRLAVSGAATLNGTLNVTLDGGFVPAVGDTFQVMTYASRSGDFATKNGLNPTATRRLTTTAGATTYTINSQGINPGTLQFSSATASGAEGAAVTVLVTRSGGSDGPVSVTFGTSDGTAASGSDYVPTSGTLTWADGDTLAKAFTVYALTDAATEGGETVNLRLNNPTGGAALGTPAAATLTITDVILVPANKFLQFAAATFSANRGGGSATVTVTRTNGSGGAVSVPYATADGSAVAGQDYTATSGTLHFADGETSKSFTVALRNDGTVGDATFLVTLGAPTGAVLGAPASAVVTIVDNTSTREQRYVNRLYVGTFGRHADAAGLLYWANGLEQGFFTRDQVVNGLLTSLEYRTLLVVEQYRTFLLRDPDAAGLSFWITYLANGGRVEDLKSGFMGSQEYFNNAGATNLGFLHQVYRDLFGREIDDGGRDFWLGRLNSGQLSRAGLSVIFVTTTEYEQTLVQSFYKTYLGREADAGALGLYIDLLQRNILRDEGLIQILAASDESFNRG